MKKNPAPKQAKGALREMRIEVHRDAAGKITGHTVNHEYERPKQKTSSPAFYEERPKASHPFGAGEHEAMIDHIDEHLDDGE